MKKQKKTQPKTKKRTQNKFGLSYVEGLKDLKKLLSEGYYEFRLQLGEKGIIYSKKTIYYHPETKKYQIFNWIDETDQILTEKQLMNKKITNIGLGLKRRALIVDLNEKNN